MKDKTISRNTYMPILALLAGITAFGMIIFMGNDLVRVFRMSDPTGTFGWMMQLGGFSANICVIFLAIITLLERKSPDWTAKKSLLFIFGIKLCEVLAISPCFAGYGEALCGLWWVMFANFSAPLIILITVLVVLKAEKPVRVSGFILLSALVTAGMGAFFLLTPRTPEQCVALPEVTSRAACLNTFAMKSNSGSLCRQIEFRSTRFQCLYTVAEKTENPLLCEEIQDTAGTVIAAYETPALATRDLCYYLLGFKMQNRDFCLKVTNEKMREACTKGAGHPGRKRKLL